MVWYGRQSTPRGGGLSIMVVLARAFSFVLVVLQAHHDRISNRLAMIALSNQPPSMHRLMFKQLPPQFVLVDFKVRRNPGHDRVQRTDFQRVVARY